MVVSQQGGYAEHLTAMTEQGPGLAKQSPAERTLGETGNFRIHGARDLVPSANPGGLGSSSGETGASSRGAHVSGYTRALLPVIGFASFICAASVARHFAIRLPAFCLFREITGLPCPGCGVTRSVLDLVCGRVHASWQENPAGGPVIIFFAASAILATAEARGILSAMVAARIRLTADRALAVALLAVWVARLIASW